jgi:predicted SnoaL-like aldol condensation-catalyzing enzyme
MAISDMEKALTVLRGMGSGDGHLATRHIDPKKYREHNPRSADGVDGLREYIRQVSKEEHHLKVVRAFQDGPYVLAQTRGTQRWPM